MKKILFCLPLLLLALQSCEIEDEYMYDKGLYTIDWAVSYTHLTLPTKA